MSSDYNKLKDEVAAGLKKNANILIQSKHGDDNNDLVIDAVEKAGLKLFSMELGDPKVRKGSWSNEDREKSIRSYLKDEKANALLVDMHPDNDITAFVKVAKDLNIPLIVSMTNDMELKAGIFENKEQLVSAVKGEEPKVESKEDVVARIKGIQAQTTEKKSSKKLNSRI